MIDTAVESLVLAYPVLADPTFKSLCRAKEEENVFDAKGD